MTYEEYISQQQQAIDEEQRDDSSYNNYETYIALGGQLGPQRSYVEVIRRHPL